MALPSTPPKTPTGSAAGQYRWPLRIIGLLLLIQASSVLALSLFFSRQIDWQRELADSILSIAALDIIAWDIVVAPLIILLIITAIGFFFQRAFAWLFAMTLQGVMLLGCLSIYFLTNSYLRNSHFIYLTMVYCIMMVLYLNSSDVRIAFQVKKRTRE
ncbi:MAG: hypothetical protein R3C14_01765 [Caldilineaceae bacterium]